MDKVNYLNKLLDSRGVDLSLINKDEVTAFASQYEITQAFDSIIKFQQQIMEKWKINTLTLNFINLAVSIPNGTEKKSYRHAFNADFFNNQHISHYKFEDLESIGLSYDMENCSIYGTPNASGDFKINIQFKVVGESDSAEWHNKTINLIINPDPKSLWQNIHSDKKALYWKPDTKSNAEKFGKKSIVVSSVRGRSHENVGSFRDDDYAYKHFSKSDWSVVAVSDGAGSATLSRKGSELACEEVISYFENHILKHDELKPFENKVKEFSKSRNEALLEEAKVDAKKILYKATIHVHNKLSDLAEKTFEQHPELFTNSKAKNNLEYFHSTLIFTAFKKLEIGYAILTFGVGDCPIGIIDKSMDQAKLLNWLDVGEFGGGTRFITQNDIFHSKERPMSTRFNIQFHDDFSYLFLMTDGIYDPKFVVEANLEKTEKWLEFLLDLAGKNEDAASVDFMSKPFDIEAQLNTWMAFWSKGNHDDRTLAIIY